MSGYSEEWRDRIPGRVFGCLRRGELKIVVMPGVGLANGGTMYDVSMDVVPFELRTPNTSVWLRVDESWQVQEVWRRDAD